MFWVGELKPSLDQSTVRKVTQVTQLIQLPSTNEHFAEKHLIKAIYINMKWNYMKDVGYKFALFIFIVKVNFLT